MPYQLSRNRKTPEPDAISKLGGLPQGITAKNWPHIWHEDFEDEVPMVHLLTIEAKAIEVEATDLSVVAFALFVSDTGLLLHFDDPTADFAVIGLTHQDMRKGNATDLTSDWIILPEHQLIITPTNQTASNQAGGAPQWIQDEGSCSGFVLQANEDLLEINLGDDGELYMFEDWAMWQSH